MTLTRQQFEFLRGIDTPTVCNLIEIVAPRAARRRLHGQAPALPVSRPAAHGRLRQDRDHPGQGRRAARASRLHAEAPRLSRLRRRRAAPEHRGDRGPRRRARRLRRVLGRGAVERAQGARLPRHRHQRLRSATFRRSPPGSRCSPARSCRRTPMCTWSSSAARRDHPRHGGRRAAISSTPTATARWSCRPTRSTPCRPPPRA